MDIIHNMTSGNVTYNQTTEDVPTNSDLVLKWTSFLIFLGIICSNIVVIVLLHIGDRKSRMGFFVANLAIADRAYVIVKPLAAASTGKHYRYGLALSAWVIGCIIAIPYGVQGRFIEKTGECRHELPSL
ncbi:Hypothetical predicted protein, partial [Mytilus galloprovincialis]